MFRKLERLLALVVLFPPVYIVYRYLRWYFKSEDKHEA
jgi:hypothetical protein